jgi:hypothetical protein
MSPSPGTLIAFLKGDGIHTITKRVAAHFQVEDLDAIARRAVRLAHIAEAKVEFPKPRRRAEPR